MGMKWEILEHRALFKRFFSLDEYRIRYDRFEGGSHEVVREVFERGNAAGVLPYDPYRDEVLMVEQFRPGAVKSGGSPWLLELVAGMVDPGETPEDSIRREAREEAGCELENITLIYDYLVSPGGTTEQVKCYIAKADTEKLGGIYGLDHEHEDIKVHVIKRTDALQMLADGKISNALAIIGLQWLALNYPDIKTKWG